MFKVYAFTNSTSGGSGGTPFEEAGELPRASNVLDEAPIGGCEPGAAGLNLGDCYTTGIDQTTTVRSLFETPADLVNLLVANLFALSGLILLFFFIYAGFQYISDTSKGKDTAREILSTALKGLVLMFCAYWIAQLAVFMTGVDSPL